MFVRKNYSSNGRISLAFARSYRDEKGKVRQKHVETIGFLDELEKIYDDPVAHFREVARQRTLDEAKEPIPLSLDTETRIDAFEPGLKNLGYLVLEKLYHELGLHVFFRRRENRLKIDYNLNALFRFLVFSRIIDPCSKKRTFERQTQFFESYVSSLESVYRGLDYFDQFNLAMQSWLNEQVKERYGRWGEEAYYDVTNYYFEIDEEDDFRRRGPSKEYRRSPIVQMGLLLDQRGLPMAFHLFPGNSSEKLSLNPLMNQVRENYGLKRLVIVADKGLNCGNNIAFQLAAGNGYIYSQTIRGADAKFKAFVTSEGSYRSNGEEGLIKSRIVPKTITFKDKNNRKKTIQIDQKQVVFYSQKYADKARYERARTIEKAKRYLNRSALLPQYLSQSAASYIKGLHYNEDGEIVTPKTKLYLDEEKIARDAQFDGYYAIVTSELDLPDEDIVDTYHGLWKIEETFKLSKSELRARPVFLAKEAHITAHFLICFVSMLLMRLLELRMNEASLEDTRPGAKPRQKRYFSSFELIRALRNFNCSLISENIYNFHYTDDVIPNIEEVFKLDLSTRYRRLGDIRKMIAAVKK